MSCTPELRKTELRFGLYNSMVVGTIYVSAILIAGLSGADPKITVPVFTFVSNILAYTTDILASKICFEKWDDSGQIMLLNYSRSDMECKFRWLLRSFVSLMFVRNVALSLLDALIVGKLSEMARKKLDDAGILTGENYLWIRNAAVPLFINLVTFNLVMNSLRFAWVYEIEPDVGITVIVGFWLIYMLTHS